MPRVEREEFFNAGVILFCSSRKFLQCRINLDEKRLRAFCGVTDLTELKEYLAAFEKICKGGKDAAPIGELPIAERFRWLTATRSTVVQTSKVHSGLCEDPLDMLEKLYAGLVL
jgi:hypothetical protein